MTNFIFGEGTLNGSNVGYKELSCAEKDVLYKLGKYGNQDDADLPSKGGMCDLIKKGLADKDYSLDKPNFLTEFGIGHYNRLSMLINKRK